MLRGLVLLFALLNAALFFWAQSDPHWLQSDREPQRLGHQVAPDAIQVLPDLPGASGASGAENSTSTTFNYGAAPPTAASDGKATGSGGASGPTRAASGPAGGVGARVKAADASPFGRQTSGA
jgi:hypothetical protein